MPALRSIPALRYVAAGMTYVMKADRYTTVAIALHWLIGLAIIFMLALGLLMNNLPDDRQELQYKLYQLHKSVGITILALSLLRLIWRLMHRPPPLPAGTPRRERLLSQAVHWAFYGFMIGMPLTGWAMVTVSPLNIPTVLYGVVTLPPLPGLSGITDRKAADELFANIHNYAAFTLIALIPFHIGAALFHRYVRHDEVLHHMLPLARRSR